MFETIYFSKLRNSESAQFFNDAVKLCKNNDPETLQIAPQLAILETSVQQLNANLNPERGSDFTHELVALDERRDKAITCLRTLAEGYSLHYKPELQAAGERVLNVIDSFGSGIYRMNYQAETNVLQNLGTKLQTDTEAVNALSTIGHADLVDEMVTANTAFNDLYLQRVKEEAAASDVSAGELIVECNKNYRTLLAHIRAHATLSPGEIINMLISQLNELIEKYVQLVASRTGRTEEEVA